MSNTIHLSNGEILCEPDKGQFSRSLTISNSIVTALDSNPIADVQTIDLQGKFAMPGFIDSHLHLTFGASSIGEIDLSQASSREEFIQTLTKEALANPNYPWVVASGWSERTLGEVPVKDWLDDLGDTPTICFSQDLHTAIVNDPILKLLDLDTIYTMLGSDQLTNGIVREDALFDGIGAIIPEVDRETKISRTRAAIENMNKQGVTLVGTMETTNDMKNVLMEVAVEQHMRCRVMCLDLPTEEAIEFCSSLHDPYLQVNGFKSFLDGSLGSRTAKMYEPWADATGDGLWAGVAANNTFHEWLSCVQAAEFSPIVHAIGDQAVGFALDSMAGLPRDLLPRIEHAQFIAEKDLMKVANSFFGVQPLHLLDDAPMAIKAVGKKRIETLHNWRGMVDAGAILSFGSDWPVAAVLPIATMQVAIEQDLTVGEVLKMSTSYSADSLRTPQAGRLSVGSFGDVVVLDRNPFYCDWKTNPPAVLTTIIGGKIVYEKGQGSA